MAPGIYIGTSGWNYPGWARSFYQGIPKRGWLRHYARTFNALEINATFYRLQRQSTLERWVKETPTEFVFCMKGNRYLTHNKRLADARSSVQLEHKNAKALRDKLRVVLWQLPTKLQKHMARLEGFAEAVEQWNEVRHVLEFRHTSWFDAEVAEMLRGHGMAVCLSDAADWPMWDAVTTDLVYVRLHGHTRTYASTYSKRALQAWAQRVRDWSKQGYDVHVYFDNDSEGAAFRDARRLREYLQRFSKP